MRSIPTALAAVSGLAALLAAWPAPAAAAPDHNPNTDPPAVTTAAAVVIQQFTPAGLFATDDEYVLLRNLGGQSVVLDGWSVRACTPSGPLFTIVLTGQIQAQGFLLLAGDGYSGFVSRDVGYSGDVPKDGGWLVRDELGGNVDGVGLSANLPCTEGDPAPDCDWESRTAAVRDASGTDTDNNADDFTCQARSPGL